MATEPQLDPQSLVARIIAELQANPEAQQLLLRALLTNEFLGMPARLDAIEKDIAELKVDVAQLKEDVTQLKEDVAELKEDVGELKNDVGTIKGIILENTLHRRLSSEIYHPLQLRRPRLIQSPMQHPGEEFIDLIDDAVLDGRISSENKTRIDKTDFIIRAQRRSERTVVWIVAEVSNRVGESDIVRARESADLLGILIDEEIVSVVAGYSIDPRDLARAEAAGVMYIEVEEDD